jgi:hypothetical protein
MCTHWAHHLTVIWKKRNKTVRDMNMVNKYAKIYTCIWYHIYREKDGLYAPLLFFLSPQSMVAFFKLSMHVASGAPSDSYTMTSSHEETYMSYRQEYPEIVKAAHTKDDTLRAKTGFKSATRFQRHLETILGIILLYAMHVLINRFMFFYSLYIIHIN